MGYPACIVKVPAEVSLPSVKVNVGGVVSTILSTVPSGSVTATAFVTGEPSAVDRVSWICHSSLLVFTRLKFSLFFLPSTSYISVSKGTIPSMAVSASRLPIIFTALVAFGGICMPSGICIVPGERVVSMYPFSSAIQPSTLSPFPFTMLPSVSRIKLPALVNFGDPPSDTIKNPFPSMARSRG